MDLGLKGRSAAVAAASRGLGRATALALAREGCAVAICGRDPKKIRASAEFIERETGGRVLAVTADVGSRGETAVGQAHVFTVCRLALEAQANAVRLPARPISGSSRA